MASVKLEMKGARSVVVMILDNGPSDQVRFPVESEFYFFKKIGIGGAKQAEELTKS